MNYYFYITLCNGSGERLSFNIKDVPFAEDARCYAATRANLKKKDVTWYVERVKKIYKKS